MKPHEINRVIAKECGWVFQEYGPWQSKWLDPEGGLHEGPPNYYESRDACEEFEKTIKDYDTQSQYFELLALNGCPNDCDEFNAATATSAQRCEAFLRLRGLRRKL